MKRTVTITIELPAEMHKAAVSRLQGLQARQVHLLGGEPPAKDRFGMSEYVTSCLRADLIQHQRHMETEARMRAAHEESGHAAKVAA